MSFLALKNISRQWDGQGGVQNISLNLPQGAFLSILGPSGCGKSTLLRLVAGLEKPQEGRIFIDSKDVTALPAAQRNLSMVFQSYALFPHLSVAEKRALRPQGAPHQPRRAGQTAGHGARDDRAAGAGAAQTGSIVRRSAPAGRLGPGSGGAKNRSA